MSLTELVVRLFPQPTRTRPSVEYVPVLDRRAGPGGRLNASAGKRAGRGENAPRRPAK